MIYTPRVPALDGVMVQPGGTYVVGITLDDVDIQQIESEISKIKGVSEVHFNYMTRKLTITHDGAEKTLQQIHHRLLGVTRLPK